MLHAPSTNPGEDSNQYMAESETEQAEKDRAAAEVYIIVESIKQHLTAV